MKTTITISRQYGSGGRHIAALLQKNGVSLVTTVSFAEGSREAWNCARKSIMNL